MNYRHFGDLLTLLIIIMISVILEIRCNYRSLALLYVLQRSHTDLRLRIRVVVTVVRVIVSSLALLYGSQTAVRKEAMKRLPVTKADS